MKILFLTKDRTHQLENSTVSIIKYLSKQATVITWSEDGNISDILAQLSFRPDFILINDFKPEYSPRIFGLRNIRIPKGAIFHDLHYKKFQRNKFIIQEEIDVVFTHYKNAFLHNFPDLITKMEWFPHAIDPEIYKDYHLPKTIDYLMIGALYPVLYPFRNTLYRSFRNETGFIYHGHPGYRTVSPLESQYVVDTIYAKEINRSKLFLTCDSIFHYPLKKYFEVPACNTLLLAPSSNELYDLGFRDGVHYISINEHDFHSKAQQFLQNQTLREEIALNGFHFVHKEHSLEVRIKKMMERISKKVNGNRN